MSRSVNPTSLPFGCRSLKPAFQRRSLTLYLHSVLYLIQAFYRHGYYAGARSLLASQPRTALGFLSACGRLQSFPAIDHRAELRACRLSLLPTVVPKVPTKGYM